MTRFPLLPTARCRAGGYEQKRERGIATGRNEGKDEIARVRRKPPRTDQRKPERQRRAQRVDCREGPRGRRRPERARIFRETVRSDHRVSATAVAVRTAWNLRGGSDD